MVINCDYDYEALSFKFNSTDKTCVEDTLDMMPLCSKYSNSKLLRKQQSYQSLCLENALMLENFEPLQCYFLPSNESQFLIAIPTGLDCTTQIVKSAQPIIQNLRSTPRHNITPVIKLKKNIKINMMGMSPPPLVQNDSLKTLDVDDSYYVPAPTTTTPICTTDIIYMIMIMIFLFVTCLSSNNHEQ